MNAGWTIQLFGSLCARRDTERITRFATHKTAALLAYLAYYREQAHLREELIELLWSGCEPAAGRNRLNTLLSFLRHLLEPPGIRTGTVLQADRIQVRLNCDALTTDVAEFERLLRLSGQTSDESERLAFLQQALVLYRNGLLPGYYDDWVLREQARLNERHADALHELAWSLQQTGALEAALETAHKALDVDPYRESSYRLQMRLYAALGQPMAAQQTYRVLQQRFQEELGVAPSAATRELAEQVRRDPQAVVRLRETAAAVKTGNGSYPAQSGLVAEPAAPSPFLPANASSASSSLPAQLTRFFGREEQTEQLLAWLTSPAPRLVTLTGPGGSGKTRLAIEVARQAAPVFGGRVWFVDLAALRDGRLLPYTLAHTLRLTLTPQFDLLEQVVRKLQEGPSLLLLDNFEQLLRAGTIGAQGESVQGVESVLLVRLLLERAPDLKCLVTSRQPLHLAGEQELSVPVLPIPPVDCMEEGEKGRRGDKVFHASHSSSIESQVLSYASVALYVDRARAVRSEFALTGHNVAAVCALCQRLEGMPLALEMAAAWIKTLPPVRMLERLERQLDLLVSRRRDVPARQQSLRATQEWSYDLLEPELQRCFVRLSVFRGGWDWEAAEYVCRADDGIEVLERSGVHNKPNAASDPERLNEILDLLTQLQERSLVSAEETEEAVRYRMLESLREYASKKLTESGDQAEVQWRHADHFLAVAEEAMPKLGGSEQAQWLDRLAAEHDNLRTALAWYQAEPEGAEKSLRLAGALWRFWELRGHLREGRMYLAAALKREGAAGRTLARATALNGAGVLASDQGDYEAAKALHEESLAISRPLGDKPSIAASLDGLGLAAHKQGDFGLAGILHEESLAIRRELGEKPGIALSLNNLGNVAYKQNDYAAAGALYEESLAIRRELGDNQGIATSLNNLGNVARDQGDYGTAKMLFEESLVMKRELEDMWGASFPLNGLGNVACDQGDYAAARAFYQESLAIKQELGEKRGIAYSLNGLGNVARDQGDYAAARALYQEALTINREVGDREAQAINLHNLGGVVGDQGDYEVARAMMEEALPIHRQVGNRIGEADNLDSLGSFALYRGDFETAQERYEESLIIHKQLRDKRGISQSLEAVAALSATCGDAKSAARLYGAAEALRDAIGAPLPPNKRAKYDCHVAELHSCLGEEAFAAAWAEGRATTTDQAIEFALRATTQV